MFYLQVEVDWEKINAKIDMELKNEASRPGAKPYNGWHGFIYVCVYTDQHFDDALQTSL